MASHPKSFLLLSIRAEEVAAADELAAFARFTGLDDRLHRHRLDREPLGRVDLDDWAGVILGGGSFNASDPVKSDVQRRVEAELEPLLAEVVAADFPFLGACYGIGTLGQLLGAVVDRSFGEPVGPLQVELTAAGADDPLFAGVPARFDAFGGHKEAISWLPDRAVVLATSDACPVQAFRVGRRVYATQFHPELDVVGIATRIEVYQDYGYFDPADAAAMIAGCRGVDVRHPMTLLRNFVALAGG